MSLHNCYKCGCGVSTDVVRESDLSVRNLPFIRVTPEMVGKFDNLGGASCSDRMTFGFQPTAWVDRDGAIKRGLPLLSGWTTLSIRKESKRFCGKYFGPSKAIMYLTEIDILWPMSSLFIRLLRCVSGSGRRYRTVLIGNWDNVSCMAKAGHINRPAERRRQLGRCDDNRTRAVRKRAAIHQPEWIRNHRRIEYLRNGRILSMMRTGIQLTVGMILDRNTSELFGRGAILVHMSLCEHCKDARKANSSWLFVLRISGAHEQPSHRKSIKTNCRGTPLNTTDQDNVVAA
jgi:hypothetical protein